MRFWCKVEDAATFVEVDENGALIWDLCFCPVDLKSEFSQLAALLSPHAKQNGNKVGIAIQRQLLGNLIEQLKGYEPVVLPSAPPDPTAETINQVAVPDISNVLSNLTDVMERQTRNLTESLLAQNNSLTTNLANTMNTQLQQVVRTNNNTASSIASFVANVTPVRTTQRTRVSSAKQLKKKDDEDDEDEM